MSEHPVAATGHMPFPGHRSLAEIGAGIEGRDQARPDIPNGGPGGLPVALVRFDMMGEMQLGIFGEGVRLLVIDERAAGDRVYEVTHHEPLRALDQLIPPDSVIGHANDARHEAMVARMTALFEGRPYLQVVPSGEDAAA